MTTPPPAPDLRERLVKAIEPRLTDGRDLDGVVAVALTAIGEQWRFFNDDAPEPHSGAYRVFDPATARFFDGAPCYGLHAPWWVPRNGYTGAESEPIQALGTYWRSLPPPPSDC